MHADQGLARFAILGAMGTMFLVSLTIPEAFAGFPGGLNAPLLFAGSYLVVRSLRGLCKT